MELDFCPQGLGPKSAGKDRGESSAENLCLFNIGWQLIHLSCLIVGQYFPLFVLVVYDTFLYFLTSLQPISGPAELLLF